tara:strand:- start:327 stop:500 length:174 start_codon:yes stop_codon:yes gene_type:complete
MANWKKNKALGIGAGIMVILCIFFIAKGIMAQKNSAATLTPDLEAEQNAIEEEMRNL